MPEQIRKRVTEPQSSLVLRSGMSLEWDIDPNKMLTPEVIIGSIIGRSNLKSLQGIGARQLSTLIDSQPWYWNRR